MEPNECVLTRGKWYCPTNCDDPSHGRHGPARVYYEGKFRRPGELIETIDL